jgi:hypothetical protein
MMNTQFLEKAWGEILSRRPTRIKRMFLSLDKASQEEVIRHLQRMTTEEGWQEAQIISAKEALKSLIPGTQNNHE